ncbi:MAG: transporter permease [Verrucomicrobiaceae bacterium]|nr:transporter permease [Verrucomicrobiaceae bacterium]MDB6117231.1 transporter permease [Verrucomicrobiaceae bacterium]
MNFRIISALVMRYIFLYTRTPMRLVELVFWPMVDLLIWGYLTIYIKENTTGAFPAMISFLLGAMILWDVVFRAQQGVAVSFLEDVWTRNLLNIFVAPVRISEYLTATFAVGILRICVTVVIMCVVALLLYQFNVLVIGWPLMPFLANLLISGWALGMISTALILRWGQAAESLAWAVPFFIQPISAVFYPVGSIRPVWLQNVALAMPTTHVFEGMREVMQKGTFNWQSFSNACLLNLVFMAIAGWIFMSMLSLTKKRGLLTKFATQ